MKIAIGARAREDLSGISSAALTMGLFATVFFLTLAVVGQGQIRRHDQTSIIGIVTVPRATFLRRSACRFPEEALARIW